MSDWDDDRPDQNERATTQRVQTALTEMHAARQQFLRSMQAGMLSERDKLSFQARILDVFESLRPFRDRVSEDWENAGWFENGLEELPVHCDSRIIKEEESIGFGRTKIVQREVPNTLNPHHLRELSEDLDEIAREIGFEPAPDRDPGSVDGGVI